MLIKPTTGKAPGLLFTIFILFFQPTFPQQQTYKDSILSYQANYINTHEVVVGDDRKYIGFYPVDRSYCVIASFQKIADTKGFIMNTSSGMMKKYFQYGLLTFTMQGSLLHLYIYQSETFMQQEKYNDYLFVPFGHATSGFSSYGGGRYLDFTMADLKNKKLVLDFNKAYNPYCAYTTGYNCPIPPKENLLTVAIHAEEKTYGKPVH